MSIYKKEEGKKVTTDGDGKSGNTRPQERGPEGFEVVLKREGDLQKSGTDSGVGQGEKRR